MNLASTKSGTRKRKDSSSGDEKSGDEGEKLLQPDVFVEDKAKEADSADSLSGGSSDDSDVEEPSSNKVKVKRMAVKRGVNISSIYDPSKTNQLNEQRKVEEEIPLEKRVSTVRHDEVRHVKGGKVFQLHTGQDKTGTSIPIVFNNESIITKQYIWGKGAYINTFVFIKYIRKIVIHKTFIMSGRQ